MHEAYPVGWISIRPNKRFESRLETGDLTPVYVAMNLCMDDLVASWGLDPAQVRLRASAPELLNANSVYRSIKRTYPAAARNMGRQAEMHMRVMVDANGSATDCAVSDVTQADMFDDRACKPMLEDAEFEPARDRDGNAIPSYFAMFLHYRMN